MEQLASVGLESLKSQMLLKKLLRSARSDAACTTSSTSSDHGINVNAPGPSSLTDSASVNQVQPQPRKLYKAEMSRLPPEDKALYLMM